MAVTPEALLAALAGVADPNTGKPLVGSAKSLKNLRIADGDVSFDLDLGYPAKSQHDAIRQALVAAAKTLPGVGNVSVDIGTHVVSHAVQRG
ncbi:MAG: iron-sulfur cluster assembly protein, partial [Comamonadaceae bacterium]